MAKFIHNAGEIKKMLVYAEASGKNVQGDTKALLEDCMINVSKTNVLIKCIESNEVLIGIIKLKVSKENIKEVGDIPVKLEKAIESISRFKASDIVMVEYDEENGLIIIKRKKPRLSVKFPTIPIDNVASAIDDIPFEFEKGYWSGGSCGKLSTYIKLDASEFKEVVKDGEQIQKRNFPFTVTKTKINVIVQDMDTLAQIDREFSFKEIKTAKSISSLYAYGFGNVFGNLSGEIEIWLKNEGPMAIRKKDGNLLVDYILATTEIEEEDEDDDDDTDEDGYNEGIEDQLDDSVENMEDD